MRAQVRLALVSCKCVVQLNEECSRRRRGPYHLSVHPRLSLVAANHAHINNIVLHPKGLRVRL